MIVILLQSLTVRDRVRDCLEKDPSERTDEDIEALLEFTQHLKAFTNMTLSVRRALCSVMVRRNIVVSRIFFLFMYARLGFCCG